jgi:hypothetical protein
VPVTANPATVVGGTTIGADSTLGSLRCPVPVGATVSCLPLSSARSGEEVAVAKKKDKKKDKKRKKKDDKKSKKKKK